MGGFWLSSQGCYVNANGQESELEPTMGLKLGAHTSRAVGSLFSEKSGRPDAPVGLTRRRIPASGPQIFATCPRLQILIARSQRCSATPDQTHPASGHSQSSLCTATSAGPDAEQCSARVWSPASGQETEGGLHCAPLTGRRTQRLVTA